jgi:antirestriction protein ArdC
MISLYQKVTNAIVTQLENGVVPWVKPWSATAGRNTPCNAVTNRPYSGVNTLLLWQSVNHGFTVPRFITFRQANQCGGRVRKGQNGFRVYFVKRMKSKKEDDCIDDTDKMFTMLKEYTVFNIDQCDGLPEGIVHPEPPKVLNQDERLALAEDFVIATKADIRFGQGEAFFSPAGDFISLPSWESFHHHGGYYNTLFHELTHWTGPKHRLDRDLKNRFGTRAYAAEELVAEIGAGFLCAEFGIDNAIRNAGYISSWIKLLKDDNRAVFTAASKASAAAQYLRQLALREDEWPSTYRPTPDASPPTQPNRLARSEWDTNTKSTVPTSDHLDVPPAPACGPSTTVTSTVGTHT